MPLTITTDHKWKSFQYRADVPAKVLAVDFDYQDEADALDGYFRYHGHWYHLDQFMRLDGQSVGLDGWHAYLNDSMCSGVVIKVSRDGESYQVGTFCS